MVNIQSAGEIAHCVVCEKTEILTRENVEEWEFSVHGALCYICAYEHYQRRGWDDAIDAALSSYSLRWE